MYRIKVSSVPPSYTVTSSKKREIKKWGKRLTQTAPNCLIIVQTKDDGCETWSDYRLLEDFK